MAPKNKAEAGPSKTLGRKKKIFSESLGLDHLVQLSNQIAGDHADKLQQRVEKAKDKQAWEKERNRQRNGDKSRADTRLDVHKSGPSPLSKSSHRASLVAKQREKSKMRKEARKAAKKEVTPAKDAEMTRRSRIAAAEERTGRKRVSFA